MNKDKIREALNCSHGYVEYQYRRALTDGDKRAIDGSKRDLESINEALAELDKAQQPSKVLTEEEIDGIALMAVPLGTTSHDVRIAGQSIEESAPEAVRVYVRGALRYARDHYGIGAPAAGLTVEEVMTIVKEFLSTGYWLDPVWGPNELRRMDSDLRARLTAAIEAKHAKP